MEKLTNHYDKEYMKMAMLKHEETFREQVYELHRLYRIQKILMKDIAKNSYNYNQRYAINYDGSQTRKSCVDLERKVHDDEATAHDLELTLGSRVYNYDQRKLKTALPSPDYSAPSFSSSSTSSTRDQESSSSKQQKWDHMNLTLKKQDTRLNNNNNNNHSPPWLFKALSLNMA